MNNTNTRPKRGACFTNIDTGQIVYLERIKSALTYFVCDGPDLLITDNFFDVQVHCLKPARSVGSGLVSKPKPMTSEKKTEKQELNDFFAKVALTMPFNCEECSRPLYAYTAFAKRCSSAHILPKAYFPSVATDPNNILFLGAVITGICSCHDAFDKDAETRASMKVYKKALECFELLKPKLTQHEIVKAYSYLNITFQ